MAKKSFKKATKQLAPEAGAKPSGRAYPADPHELNGQRQRLKKAAAVGAEALKSSPAATPDLYPAPAAVSLPPLTPLAVLWPTPAPAQGASKPTHAPARKVQAGPVKAAAPQVPLVPAPQSPKPAVQPEPTKLPGKAAVVAEAPMLSKVPTVRVTFVFPICQCCAKRVSLSGDFNGWSPDATPMKRYDDGHWETTVELAPGRYEYKFVRDGEWMPDLLARENVWNQHGTLNSVIEVRA